MVGPLRWVTIAAWLIWFGVYWGVVVARLAAISRLLVVELAGVWQAGRT